MTPFAQETVFRWTATTNASSSAGRRERGVIVAAFDQRNHGSRLVSEVANKDWWTGNDRFGVDLFSSFNGTASDVSNFIVHIEAYIDRKIDKHLVAGLSLGGHAAWHVLLHEPRVSDGVVFIGCADYIRLMSARAKHAELPSWTSGEPAGSMFLGSKDFPPSMVKAVSDLDPAALLMGCMFPQDSFLAGRTAQDWTHELSEEEKKTLVPLMRKTLGGKRILNLSGGEDLFVPHEASVPFLSWLEAAIRPGGWFENGGVELTDIIIEEAGHEVTPRMRSTAIDWILETQLGETLLGIKATTVQHQSTGVDSTLA
jgi:pimeloyl-ACP methyl ester carboxylesterase